MYYSLIGTLALITLFVSNYDVFFKRKTAPFRRLTQGGLTMPIKIETVRTDAWEMDYFRFGQGPRTLVILPGLSVQSVMLAADAVADAYRSLADTFTVYVFERRRALPPVWSVRDMARDTAQAFRSLGLENVCLFGASMGGMIALVLAVEHPELVGRMALGSTSARVSPDRSRAIGEWIELARRRDREGLYLSFGREIYPPAFFDQCRQALLDAAAAVTEDDLKRFVILAEGTRNFNAVDELTKIRCPVLAVGSYEDRVLDSDATMEIAEKLEPGGRMQLYMYVGFGHAAFDTAPDYRRRLLRFFTE